MASADEKVGGEDGYAYVENDLAGDEKPDPEIYQPKPEIYQPDPEHVASVRPEGAHSNIKSTIVISGVAVAVIGAIFAIAKKIKEA